MLFALQNVWYSNTLFKLLLFKFCTQQEDVHQTLYFPLLFSLFLLDAGAIAYTFLMAEFIHIPESTYKLIFSGL